MRTKTYLLLSIFLVLQSAHSYADEGMWLPSLISKLNIDVMHEKGLDLSADDIYSINHSSIKDAIVALDKGSCTGEIVSPEGLMFTNHHCGYREIQSHSSVDHDYLRDGFWAKTKEEELPNKGKSVSFLIRMEDVTSEVVNNIPDSLSNTEKKLKILEHCRVIVTRNTKDTHYDAQVLPLFSNNKYFLFVYETFKDVRLVGAPPTSIGKYGGDTDNWMWPRHTGDFSIFRIYTAPDGSPAEYSKENVPLKSKKFLSISLKGVKKNDFTMIMGYPGSTNRYSTSYDVDFTMNITNKIREEVRTKKLSILDKYMKSSPKAYIQYASKYAISSNYWKYSIGQNKGLRRLKTINQKRAEEKKFTEWTNENDSLKSKYGEVLSLIKECYDDTENEKAYNYFAEALLSGSDLVITSYQANALQTALKESNAAKVDSIIRMIRSGLDKFYKDFDKETDEKVFVALNKIYQSNLDPSYYPNYMKDLVDKKGFHIDEFAEKAYKTSIFSDRAKLEAFLDNPSLAILKKDKILKISQDIFNKFDSIRTDYVQRKNVLNELNKLYLKGRMEMYKDKVMYPDANSTMRITYGTVSGYSPADAVTYDYYTTLDGYMLKADDTNPDFIIKDRMKELYDEKDFGQYASGDGMLHTCFISNNDITGGNSGSPVMNKDGELIGLAFDGNWEAMSGDIAFEPNLQRCVCVDIRFVLWTIDKYAGASNIINELNIMR